MTANACLFSYLRWAAFAVLLFWPYPLEGFAQEIVPIENFRPVVVADICLGDIIFVQPVAPIPIGCEIIDCCPGCPGPGPIDWHIQFKGGPIQTITLQFEGLPAEAAQKINIKGNARWAKENQLVIGKGETVLSGFLPDPKSRPPVAIPRIEMDKEEIDRILKTTSHKAGELENDDAGSLQFILEQKLGLFVVNEYALFYRFKYCFPHPVLDKIDLENNAANDNAVIFLDARRSLSCEDDRIYRGNNIIPVGNVLSNSQTCNSEVAVFSDGDAMQFSSSGTVWTDAVGDILVVNQTPDLLQVPVTVWITVPDNPITAFNETLQPPQNQIAQANNLFNTNHAGVVFNPNYQNVSSNPAAVAAIGTPVCPAPGNIAAIAGTGFYTANQLNIYYVNVANPGGGRAYSCIFDRNIIVVGTAPQPESLAHEIGHAFSLGHANLTPTVSVDYNVDTIPDFANTNVMWSGGIGRTTFSEGQDFRMNLNPTSVLNANGTRSGPTRNCPDATISVQCPWLGLDAIPN